MIPGNLTIGFDAKRLLYNHTGLGNYSRSLLRALKAYYPEHTYRLLAQHSRPSVYLDEFEEMMAPVHSASLLWRSWGICRDIAASGADIFHGLSAELPQSINKTPVAKVVTIHDVIFKKYPDWYPAIDRAIYNYKTRYACHQADAIIAISERTKNDIIEYYNVHPDKIHVVYQNCSAHFSERYGAAHHERVSQKWSLPERYFLTVGRLEERKNLMTVARALMETDEDVYWVCVGRDAGSKGEITAFLHENDLNHRVLFLESIPVEELVSMYQQAIAFVYISLYEGFGIPVLEGMRAGVPVISSDTDIMHEVAGEAGSYIHPEDFRGLAQQINELKNDAAWRDSLIRSQSARALVFSDEQFARGTMDVYMNL